MGVSDEEKALLYQMIPDTPEVRQAVDILIENRVITAQNVKDVKIWHTYRMKLKTVDRKMYAAYDTCIEMDCGLSKIYRLKEKFG